ncbi:MAG: GSCFA domain-containing protein [Prevotella sp.]|nr:GSCFA domain-containing protein [Candidatus Prevotella equi]
MQLQTPVNIPKATFHIQPKDKILFVGSCFANNIGERFRDDNFDVIVNPYGVMYNPASVLHTVQQAITDGTIGSEGVDIAVFTLGTNHVYILNETGEIVDNCQKRPQRLFTEKELTIEECCHYLDEATSLLLSRNPSTHIIFTVSPIRYAKYGFHESQLSKATLLLSVNNLQSSQRHYFPAYEIMNDELRDYRFYDTDMLHPSSQAVDYIHERFIDTYFSSSARQYIEEWRPIRKALSHRPFNPESEEHKAFMQKVLSDKQRFLEKWT